MTSKSIASYNTIFWISTDAQISLKIKYNSSIVWVSVSSVVDFESRRNWMFDVMTKKTSLHRATPVHSVYQNDYLFFNILILNGAHLKIFGLSCCNFPNHEILHQKFPKIRILWLNARIRLKCFRSSDWSCCQFLIENAVMKFLESFEFRFVQSVFLWFVHSSISHQFHFLRFLKIFTKSSFLLILGYSSQKVFF